MHDCISCAGACYCDMEDHDTGLVDECEGCGCLEAPLRPRRFSDLLEDEVVTTYLLEVEARQRQIELEAAGQLRLLP